MHPLFALGSVVITATANDMLSRTAVLAALARHANGDWGDLDRDDWQANEQALNQGLRLLSVYQDEQGVSFWIITEWDRSVTTILLPSDY